LSSKPIGSFGTALPDFWNTMAALYSKLEVEKKPWLFFQMDHVSMLFSPLSD
jgi:hypothetical protein